MACYIHMLDRMKQDLIAVQVRQFKLEASLKHKNWIYMQEMLRARKVR